MCPRAGNEKFQENLKSWNQKQKKAEEISVTT